MKGTFSSVSDARHIRIVIYSFTSIFYGKKMIVFISSCILKEFLDMKDVARLLPTCLHCRDLNKSPNQEELESFIYVEIPYTHVKHK